MERLPPPACAVPSAVARMARFLRHPVLMLIDDRSEASMDQQTIDRNAWGVADYRDRRSLVSGLAGTLLAAVSAPLGVEAKKGKKRCKRRARLCRTDLRDDLCRGQPQVCVDDLNRCCKLATKCKSNQKVIACCEDAGWCL